MADVGIDTVRLVDTDGDALDDGEGRLNINATLESATVNVGDVDIVSVPAPLSLTGGGTESAALRVTIANDSTGVLSIDDGGGSLTIDGTVTANLSAVDNAVLDTIHTNTLAVANAIQIEDAGHVSGNLGIFVLGIHNEDNGATLTADGDYSGIGVDRYGYVGISTRAGAFALLARAEDSAHSTTDHGIMSLAVRRDNPNPGSGTDGDYSSLNVSAVGGLYVEQIIHGTLDTFAMLDIDNSAQQLSGTAVGVLTDVAEIMLQADEDNSGYVIVGDADVADNRGMKLNPGDSIILDIHDTRIPYLWGSAANQNVRCMLTRRLV